MIINNISNCTGCGVCCFLCPQNAIKMEDDNKGFQIPIIDNSKCINCGLCVRKCSSHVIPNSTYTNIFYVFSKNKKVLRTSTSGGFFTELATVFLKNGGVVFASELNSDLECKHIEISDISELQKVRSSKYIQSLFSPIYQRIKSLLSENKKVLVCGTSCQIAAVKNLFPNAKCLYTVELLCHGVPSQKLFTSYIKYLENKKNIKIISYEFRNKKYAGWSCGAASVYTDSNHRIRKIEGVLDPYYISFLKGVSLRDSCYFCKFNKLNRIGDITIGDAWGMEKKYPNINIRNGANICIINNSKGDELLKLVNSLLFIYPVSLEDIQNDNSKKNRERNKTFQVEFYKKFVNNNSFFWDNIEVDTKIHSIIVYLKRKFFYHMPFIIKKLARRIFK